MDYKNHLSVRTQKAERLVKTTEELNRGSLHNTHKHTLLIPNKLFHFGEKGEEMDWNRMS